MEKEKYQKELYELSVCCTGVSFKVLNGAVNEYGKQVGHEMQYQYNNGVFAFVDQYGDTYILPYTDEVRAKLFLAGYTEGIVNVPMSNGEQVIDNERFKSKWESIKKAEDYGSEREKYLAELVELDLRDISRKKGVKSLPENVYEFSLDMDSLSYTDKDGNIQTLPKTHLKYDEVLRTANTGTYNVLNGIIVFIDEKGKTFFAPINPYIEEQLKECGYKLDASLQVPFSNGENIVKDNVVAQKFGRLKEMSRRFSENIEFEELYTLISDKYEQLTIDSRTLDEEITTETYSFKSSERMRKQSERELQRLKALHSEISNLLSSKKVISPKELRNIIAKYGTITKDGFVLYDEEIRDEEVEEQIDDNKRKDKTEEPEKLTNISERDRIIRQQLQEIANRSRIKGVSPVLKDWLINVEGLKDDRGNSYTSYLKYNALTKENNIGTYCTNNGVIVIIDTDGQTYVAPYNSKVKNALIFANFSERDMAVPFSNGEKIANNDELRDRFDKLREISLRKLETQKFASNRAIDRLEDKYVEISSIYMQSAKEVKQKEARLKFIKQGRDANYDKMYKKHDECRKYSYMVEDLLNQCKNRLAMSAKKVEERMDSHDLSSEEEMAL